MAADSDMVGPCSGMTVIDMSSLVAGPYAGQFLADLGAEVIKVESPGSDLMRISAPGVEGISSTFEQHNRGKKSIVVNLKTPEGRDTVRELSRTADVFLQNSRTGVMERLGLGYEDLKPINPSIIYTSVSGFGDTGPYANRAAYDGVIQGMTGFLYKQGNGKGPLAIRSMVADRITAIFASHATLAALLHRQRTGEGQKVVVSMLRAYAAFILPELLCDFTFPDADLPPVPDGMGAHTPLKTADGQVIGMVLQRHQFEALVKALGREDLLDDERFATVMTISPNSSILYELIEPQTTAMSTDAFLELAAEAGVPFGRINDPQGFLDDPQAIHTGAWFDFEDPLVGRVRHLGYPAEFSLTPANTARRAPTLGEHTDEILARLGERAG